MGGLCAGLLKPAANPLKLSVPVPEFSPRCKVRCTGGGDVDNTKVNAENCPVLVVILYFDLFLGLFFSKSEVEVVFAIAF